MTGEQLTNVLPLSLLSFRECTKIYKFQNVMNESHNKIRVINKSNAIGGPTSHQTTTNRASKNSIANTLETLDEILDEQEEIVLRHECMTKNLSRTQEIDRKPELIDRHLNKHLTPKKMHEISKLSNIIDSIVDHNCKLFDVGAGVGLLSRQLAFKFKFNSIVSVDCNANLLSKARKFDDQLIKNFSCLESGARPAQVKYTMNKDNYHQLVENAINVEFGLIGLHTCGNLSHDLLELHKSSRSKHLFLCSCCYHKTKEDRYLISKHLKTTETLSVETRANACHSLDNFIDSLRTKPNELKVHTYRALLEQLFELKSPNNRKQTLAKVHNLSEKTFHQYVECSLRNNAHIIDKLDLQSEEINSLVECRLDKSVNVLIFYALRTLLGPVTETVLLADRMLFLYEGKQIESKLIPLFDTRLSPRNFILLSTKNCS